MPKNIDAIRRLSVGQLARFLAEVAERRDEFFDNKWCKECCPYRKVKQSLDGREYVCCSMGDDEWCVYIEDSTYQTIVRYLETDI